MAEEIITEQSQDNIAEATAQQSLKARLLETLETPAEEMDSLKVASEFHRKSSASKTRLHEFLLGTVVLIFAVIGAITCGKTAVKWVQNRIFAEKHRQETIVQETILPLVVMDIPVFDSPEALSDTQRIAAAVWSMIVDGRMEGYPEAMGMCTVPAADVTAAIHALFGNTVNCVHQTVAYSSELRFYYDESLAVYYVSEAPALFSYIPEVRALKTDESDGALLKAEVAYAAEQPRWRHDAAEQIVKVVEFSLRADGSGGYYVTAMRQLEDEASQQSPY